MKNTQYRLGADGELEEVKTGPKRKRGVEPETPSTNVFFLILGVLVVFIAGIGGGLFLNRATSGSVYRNVVLVITATSGPEEALLSTRTPILSSTPLPTLAPQPSVTPPHPTATIATRTHMPPAASPTTVIPASPTILPPTRILTTPISGVPPVPAGRDGLIIGTTAGDILVDVDGTGFKPLPIKGHDVAVSPDGRSLAYWRADPRFLYIYQDGKETVVTSYGNLRFTAWGPGGKSIAYLASGNPNGDVVFWLKKSGQFSTSTPAIPIGPIRSISAPPLTDPVSGRILIVANISIKLSAFFTVDPLCDCQDKVMNFAHDYIQVGFFVNWATYRPDGKQIIFSDDNGNLYVLDTQNRRVTPFVTDKVMKNRPVFNPDGTKLAYFDDNGVIYVVTVSDMTIAKIQTNLTLESLDWLPAASP